MRVDNWIYEMKLYKIKSLRFFKDQTYDDTSDEISSDISAENRQAASHHTVLFKQLHWRIWQVDNIARNAFVGKTQ